MEVERPSFWQGLRCVSRTNELPCKTRPKQPQSISMTSPVLRIRICIAFCKLKKVSAQAKPRGKSKEGGRSPLLGRFKGDCQGGESKLPLDYSFFRPSTALSFSYEKESGVENVSFLTSQKKVCRRRHTAPSGAEFFYFPNRSSIIAGTLTTDSSVVRNTPAEAVWLSAWHS